MKITRKSSWIIFALISFIIILSAFALGVNAETNAVAGFSGKVVSVDTGTNSFQAEVRLMYAGAKGVAFVPILLAPGKVVTVHISTGTTLKNFRGQVINLTDVQAGALFNADVAIDTTTKVITANSIQFVVRGQQSQKPKVIEDRHTVMHADSVVGFGGKIVSVDTATNSFQAEVHGIYAAMSHFGFIGGILPQGKIVNVKVPAGTIIKRFGTNVPLNSIQPGDLFNAMVLIDSTNKTITAKTIQLFSTNFSTVFFWGNLTNINKESEPKSITVQNEADSRIFLITDKTKFWAGNANVGFGGLNVGGLVGVTYYTSNSQNFATGIAVGDRAKFLNVATELGKKMTRVLGNSYGRFDRIIGKMESQIALLKSEGMNTSKAEESLDKAKSHLAEAEVLLNTTRQLISDVSKSPDPEKSAKEAKESMRATIAKTRDVIRELKETLEEIRRLEREEIKIEDLKV